ncbi:MAG: transposase [Desulfovibrio sp.]|nr:transposase [Desulfovibrio sp.]
MRTCSNCGCADKDNRPSQAVFNRTPRGFEIHADLNAALNMLVAGPAVSARGARREGPGGRDETETHPCCGPKGALPIELPRRWSEEDGTKKHFPQRKLNRMGRVFCDFCRYKGRRSCFRSGW